MGKSESVFCGLQHFLDGCETLFASSFGKILVKAVIYAQTKKLCFHCFMSRTFTNPRPKTVSYYIPSFKTAFKFLRLQLYVELLLESLRSNYLRYSYFKEFLKTFFRKLFFLQDLLKIVLEPTPMSNCLLLSLEIVLVESVSKNSQPSSKEIVISSAIYMIRYII